MKIYRLLIISIILLIMILGAVSASDNTTTVDNAKQNESIDSDELISDYKYEADIPESISDMEVSTIHVYEMPKNASGNISISVDGKEEYMQKVSPGGNALILNDLKLNDGIHSASVRYTGDNKYAGFVKNGTFEKSFLRIDGMSDEIMNQHSTVLFSVHVDDDVTGNIKILIDNQVVLNEKCNGESKYISPDAISYGKHTYEVRYTGGNHKNLVKKGSFNYSYYFKVMCEDTNISAGQNVEFLLGGVENAKLTCNININGKKYKKVTLFEEKFLYISDFEIGENLVEFTTTYKSIKKTLTFKINVKPTLIVPKDMQYGKSEVIEFITSNFTKGNLSVKVDGNDYKSEKIINGKAIVTLENISVGKHILTISDGINETNHTINVVPYLTSGIMANKLANLTFKASEEIDGELIVSGILNTEVNVTNGTATIPVSKLGFGKYKVNITYENTTWNYIINAYSCSHDLNIELEYPKTTIHSYRRFEEYESQYYPFKILNIPNEFSGNFTIYHDGKFIGTYEEDLEIFPKFLEIGKHEIRVEYTGDDYFNPVNKSVTYTIIDGFMLFLDDETLTIKSPFNATGTFTVKMDGKKINTVKLSDDSEDGFTWTYVPLNTHLKYGKTYDFEVIYKGNFPKQTIKEKMKLNYGLYINIPYHPKYGEKNIISFSLPEGATSKAVVKINGETYKYTTDKYGTCNVDISKLKPGVHNITVTYPGDKTCPSKTVNETFNVNADIEITNDYSLNSKLEASLTLPADATGNLVVEINDEIYKSTPLTKGHASIIMPTDKIGKYDYRVYYDGNYDVDQVTATIYIDPTWKLSSKISPLNNAKLTIGLDKDTKGTVVFFVESIPIGEFEVDSEHNIININKTLLAKARSIAEVYALSDSFSKSCVYLDLTAELYVNGSSIGHFYREVKLTAQLEAQDIKMDYNDGSELKITVYDLFGDLAAGEKVTVKIGQNKYKIKTNSEGIASLKITEVPGKYTAKITYGDLSITKNINIKQILTLKKVTVKKSAKKLVLTAKLSKKIKGEKITFKFNGKKYVTKTDKKGVAKVTIKKSVLKKLKIGKKITYKATHVKNTVKQTVKVK